MLFGIYSKVNVGTLINSFSGILLLNKSPDTSIYVTPGLPTQLYLIAFSINIGAYLKLVIYIIYNQINYFRSKFNIWFNNVPLITFLKCTIRLLTILRTSCYYDHWPSIYLSICCSC